MLVDVPLQQITLSQTKLNLNKGAGSQLQITYNPTDTTADKTVTWSSSNTSVATVDSTGKVTAVGAGQAVITAKVGSLQANCSIQVTVPQSEEESGTDSGNKSETGGSADSGNSEETGGNTDSGNSAEAGGSTDAGSAAETGSTMPQEGWLDDGGTWYYINTDGSKATGWVCDGETWY